MAGVNKLAQKLLNNRNVIVICGATASGKTDLSIELSKILPAEIVSADSRQFYKYMDIGTAKPTLEEQKAVPHHFIDNLYPDEYFSAGKYADEAEKVIDKLFRNGKVPIVVGGSGLYIKALCEGFFDDGSDENNAQRLQIRNKLEKKMESAGIEIIYEELRQVDPASAEKYNDKNPRRIIRAMEYYYLTGTAFSVAHKEFENSNINFKPIYFTIDWDREVLYDRINIRTQIMWDSGLPKEAEKLIELGCSKELNSLNTVGYKETFDFLEGRATQEKTIELIAQHTRNYAKRQITWFKRIPNILWVRNNAATVAELLLKS